MRFSSTLLLALPAVSSVAAADQQPLADKLKGWFDVASKAAAEYLPSTVPSVHIPDPLDAGAQKVADLTVASLNVSNWQSVLSPSAPTTKGGPEEWLVYMYGGNKTCFGLCGNTTKAWNVSHPIHDDQESHQKLEPRAHIISGTFC